ncbi:cob(I)yrinic acid a,c-diamide adenosyltransferase [Dethiosulfatarculus sandiegensis]|uniref:corrinoid adenosyltransferase n=1 Tax=Dethiosulfatarculus sandiegensis TaxID=1429043 RepID=A0A0D2J1Q2_9BACT|nr:cob(I)yrinic acid a,c-diamide adenosyltransferase [Dethiosulfatarculus sandiegensis]KIX12144.1 cob(I)yrinic acid a,c-diamide adenosyltransferase [Dethiosulfatarculus sandiegensis]
MEVKKGLVMINTGHGKGKTTAALGAMARAAGQGYHCLMIQFIKGGRNYGELAHFEDCQNVEIRPTGLGLIRRNEDLKPHRQAAEKGFLLAKEEMESGKWDLLVLDEIFLALRRGFLTKSDIRGLIERKPENSHLILTGRDCPEEFFELADLVTVMQAQKHHLQGGVKSQAGVEY